MTGRWIMAGLALALAGCAGPGPGGDTPSFAPPAPSSTDTAAAARPAARPGATDAAGGGGAAGGGATDAAGGGGAAGGGATDAAGGGGGALDPAAGILGRTVASLGNPTEGGLWLATGLVTQPAPGRVRDTATGATVALELRPAGGPPGGGARLSLAALRALGLGPAALPTLEVRRE